MLKNINEMKQKRAELVKEARLMLDTAENEKRDMTAEEDQQNGYGATSKNQALKSNKKNAN